MNDVCFWVFAVAVALANAYLVYVMRDRLYDNLYWHVDSVRGLIWHALNGSEFRLVVGKLVRALICAATFYVSVATAFTPIACLHRSVREIFLREMTVTAETRLCAKPTTIQQ